MGDIYLYNPVQTMSKMAIQGQRSRLSESDIQNIKQEYRDTLEELDFNSRPHIMNLTELAHNYSKICPQVIVKLIEDRIKYADTDSVKLPTLYLLDSIMKNHGDPYKVLFSRSIVELFEAVFRKSRERDRERLFRLRQTWTPILQGSLLYTLDSTIKKKHDPAWPIANQKPAVAKSNIHINPAKFKTMPSVEGLVDEDDEELKKAERELAELKRKRLEKTKREIEELKKQQSEAAP